MSDILHDEDEPVYALRRGTHDRVRLVRAVDDDRIEVQDDDGRNTVMPARQIDLSVTGSYRKMTREKLRRVGMLES